MELHHGDCLEVLRTLADNSIDSIITDPPYGLSFMGKKWDYDVPSEAIWRECLRVLKPGGHLLAFAGTRTQHRMAVRIEDAGFEIRDMIAWVYGAGFPKSLDVSKAIDARGGASVAWFGPWFRKWREDRGITQKQVAALFPSKTGGLTGCVANWELGFNMPTPEQFNLIRDTFGLPFQSIEAAEREVIGQDTKARSTSGASALPTMGGETVYQSWDITAPATDAARQWQGWGTALKPALEPITVARKPLIGTVAENVLAHGTGALNIDGCRVGWPNGKAPEIGTPAWGGPAKKLTAVPGQDGETVERAEPHQAGRWPANLIHDGSEEVLAAFPQAPGQQGDLKETGRPRPSSGRFGDMAPPHAHAARIETDKSAARFFYCAKASRKDRHEGLDDPGSQFKHGTTLRQVENTKTTGNNHPTVKPTDLMRYLCRLVTPPGGVVLDPFMGSGSTGKAAVLEGFRFIGIEREAEYLEIARARIQAANDNLPRTRDPFEGGCMTSTQRMTDMFGYSAQPQPMQEAMF